MPTPYIKYWKLGIVGFPLGYSLSPLIQEKALKAAGFAGEYKEFPVTPEDLEGWLSRVKEAGLDGFNVTMPHKSAVWEWVKATGRLGVPARDEAVGALNTVVMREGEPVGYNTDGEGFLRPLIDPPRSLNLTGWRVVILGAGGAAKAIVAALALETKVAQVTLWNRDSVRAKLVASQVNQLRRGVGGPLVVVSEKRDSLAVSECDLLVNATAYGIQTRGMEGLLVNPEHLHPNQVVYDIVYQPRETGLIQAARSRGCTVVTGDEMLAGQGAVSFEIWTGKAGMLPVMRRALDDHFTTCG